MSRSLAALACVMLVFSTGKALAQIAGAAAPSEPTATTTQPLDGPQIQQPNKSEEAGSGPSGDALARIGNRMQLASQRIAGNDTSQYTQSIQVEIINDLSSLIEQTRQQCDEQSASSKAAADRQEAAPSERRSEQEAAMSSADPARDSAIRLGAGQSVRSEAGLVDSFIRKTWGHLPPQLRQAVLNAGNEKFLPKYEMLIEQYYRRLAEDADRQP